LPFHLFSSPSPPPLPAENYRFEEVFEEASRLIPDCGSIIKMDLVAEMPMNANNKWVAGVNNKMGKA
jgi:hypothetical protein